MQHALAPLPDKRRRNAQAAFTLVELLIGLTILLIGISGVISMQMTGWRSASYSRHFTEASVLAEDKVEQLRTVDVGTLINSAEQVDAQGNPAAQGLYTRSWTILWAGTVGTLQVMVAWNERGNEPHAITMSTQRTR